MISPITKKENPLNKPIEPPKTYLFSYKNELMFVQFYC